VPQAQLPNLDATIVFEYYFTWLQGGGIALGYGSLYNHSDAPNAECVKDVSNDLLTIRAIASIGVGDEITFSYSASASGIG
jgi:hypothetical protein